MHDNDTTVMDGWMDRLMIGDWLNDNIVQLTFLILIRYQSVFFLPSSQLQYQYHCHLYIFVLLFIIRHYRQQPVKYLLSSSLSSSQVTVWEIELFISFLFDLLTKTLISNRLILLANVANIMISCWFFISNLRNKCIPFCVFFQCVDR